jgi:PAS domain-containing protein
LLLDAIEAISEGFALFDAEDRLVLCNRTYRQLYALSADLLVPGASFSTIIGTGANRGQFADAEGRVDAWVAERLTERATVRGGLTTQVSQSQFAGSNSGASQPAAPGRRIGDHVFEQRLGDGRWLRVSDRPTRDGGIVCIRTDITAQKRAMAALAESEQRFRLLADNAADLVSLLSPDGCFLYLSPSCQRILGYRPKDLLGRSV